MASLIESYKLFYSTYFQGDDDTYSALRFSQSPKRLIISCSDSRVDPAILFSSSPGEIFSIRNVAGIVPPCIEDDHQHHGTTSGIEFAVKVLKIREIVIMGHSCCAGVREILHETSNVEKDDTLNLTFVKHWVNIIKSAAIKTHKHYEHDHSSDVQDKKETMCSKEGVIVSIENLLSFSWIDDLIRENKLEIIGMFFDMSTGKLSQYDKHFGFQEIAI